MSIMGQINAEQVGTEQMNMVHKKRIDADILIAGGSLEGCAAALCLAKAGRQVLLTEKKGSLGGSASNGLEVLLSCKDLREERERKLAETLIAEAGSREGLSGPLFHDQKCKLVLAKLLQEAGVTVLTHIFPFEVTQNTEELVCLAESKTDTLEIHCKALIDGEGFGDASGIAGAPWEMGNLSAYGAIKWNGISAQTLKEAMEPGYQEGEGFLTGWINLDYVWEKNGISYGKGLVRCCHSKKFGETITGKIKIDLPDISIFTLSNAESGMRRYAYQLRDALRAGRKGFERAAIIHVAPEMELYGIRKFKEIQNGRLFTMGISRYSNETAITTGAAVADRVEQFLKE